MKNLIKFSAICIIASIFFTSCRTNTSITERHYNKGYYISHPKNNPNVISYNEEEFKVQAKTTLGKSPHEAEKNTLASCNDKIVTNKNVAVDHNDIINKEDTKFNISKTSNSKIKIFELPDIRSRRALLKSNKNNPQDPDGLSLFWVVILIILILWALGLIGGLGGLINLLLLVALILLILWLLRVV